MDERTEESMSKFPRGFYSLTRAAVAAGLILLAAGAPVAAAEQPLHRIEGWVVRSANPSVPIADGVLDLRLTGRTTESELVSYSIVAAKDGERALRNRLADQDLGRLSIGDELGRPIALAHETRQDGLYHLIVVVDRQPDPREVFFATRSSDYPYTVLELVVDADGYGFGELYAAARLRVSPDGKLSYRSLDPVPMRVLQVSPT
jgi:hypothetical protein